LTPQKTGIRCRKSGNRRYFPLPEGSGLTTVFFHTLRLHAITLAADIRHTGNTANPVHLLFFPVVFRCGRLVAWTETAFQSSSKPSSVGPPGSVFILIESALTGMDENMRS
jgi:hypothetical protein